MFSVLRNSYLTAEEHPFVPADLEVYGYVPSDSLRLVDLVEPIAERERRQEAEAAAEAEAKEEAEAPRAKGRGRAKAQVAEPEVPTDPERDNPSTHPAIEQRLAAAKTALSTSGGAEFQVWTPDDMSRIRRQARYEVIDYYLRDQDAPQAILEAVDLWERDAKADTLFLQKAITHSLLTQLVFRLSFERYWEAELDKAKDFRAVKLREREVARVKENAEWVGAEYAHGELQRVYHLLAEGTMEELAALALSHAIRYEIAAPGSAAAKHYPDRSLELLHTISSQAFPKWQREHKEALAAATSAGLKLDQRSREANKYTDLKQYLENEEERLDKIDQGCASLNTSSLVVTTPSFRDVNYYSEQGLTRSKEVSVDQLKLIKTSMKENGIKGEVLSDELRAGSAIELNKIRTNLDYVRQFVYLYPLRLIPHNHDQMLAYLDSVKSEKVMYLQENNREMSGLLNAGLQILLIGPLMPYNTIATAFTRQAFGGLNVLVIDPRERQISLTDFLPYSVYQPSVTRSAIYYDLFHQIRRR